MWNWRWAMMGGAMVVIAGCGQATRGELRDDNERAAVRASWEQRAAAVQTACATLRESLERPEPAFYGKTHEAIRVVGNLRAVEATELLLAHIDFKLDRRTMPVGIRYGEEGYFPAAVALADIGGKKVVQAVLARLETEADEATVRLAAYVLNECWGGKQEYSAVLAEEYAKGAVGKGRDNFELAVKVLRARDKLIVPVH